jgi:hypothetical protein
VGVVERKSRLRPEPQPEIEDKLEHRPFSPTEKNISQRKAKRLWFKINSKDDQQGRMQHQNG